ncbi:hypothetical protein LA080_013141 [Diaporthe eres]|nr:hypothetical protein LA080_013141 [Diaporthe eres]
MHIILLEGYGSPLPPFAPGSQAGESSNQAYDEGSGQRYDGRIPAPVVPGVARYSGADAVWTFCFVSYAGVKQACIKWLTTVLLAVDAVIGKDGACHVQLRSWWIQACLMSTLLSPVGMFYSYPLIKQVMTNISIPYMIPKYCTADNLHYVLSFTPDTCARFDAWNSQGVKGAERASVPSLADLQG